MYIIVTGNPVDGFQFTGPYDSDTDALHDAEVGALWGRPGSPDYWIAPLDAPGAEGGK